MWLHDRRNEELKMFLFEFVSCKILMYELLYSHCIAIIAFTIIHISYKGSRPHERSQPYLHVFYTYLQHQLNILRICIQFASISFLKLHVQTYFYTYLHSRHFIEFFYLPLHCLPCGV